MTDETAVLVLVQSEMQARLIADALQERGVNARVSGALTSQFRAEAPGLCRVIVADSELERARAELEAHRQEVSEIDWSQIDVGSSEA